MPKIFINNKEITVDATAMVLDFFYFVVTLLLMITATTDIIVKTIVHGDITEEDLAKISDALRARREINATALRFSLKVGQSVWFKAGRPAYLNGVKATVSKINRERVVVDLEKPVGRFFKGIVSPVSLLSTTPIY